MRVRAAWRAATAIAVACGTLLSAASVAPQQPVRDPGPNAVKTNTEYDWAWGELLYGGNYTTTLAVNNHCPTPQMVHFFVSDPFFAGTKKVFDAGRGFDRTVETRNWLRPPIVNGRAQTEVPPGTKLPVSARAMMGIPVPGCQPVPFGGAGSSSPTVCSTVVVPGVTNFDVTIRTPPPPDLSGVIIPPGFDPHGLFEEIAGQLVVFSPADPPRCLPNREEYVPSGHVHLDPNPPPPGGGPRCRDWWDREQKPQGLTRDCTGEIRDLALTFRRTVLQPLVDASPADWAWLPAPETILRMSIEQLIEMKVRARAQMRPRR